MSNNQFNNSQGAWPGPSTNYGYGNSAYPTSMSQQSYAPQLQPQVTTNISLVTSLEEAKYRANGRNMDLIFFNQNKDEFYRIKVDNEGIKSWATFPFIAPNQPNATPATLEDLNKLSIKIVQLEEAIAQLQSTGAPKPAPRPNRKKTEEVIENGELDG